MFKRRRLRRVLGTLVVVGTVAAATAGVAWSAFFSKTSSSTNSFAAGTVAIQDNDSGAAMLALTSADHTSSDTSCIKVTYTGSLDSTVRLYASSTGGLPPYLTLTITRGTDSAPSFDGCGSFTADATNYIGAGAGVIYSGAIGSLPTTYAAGLVDPTSGSPETWSTNEAHSYRFGVTIANDPAAQNLSGTAGFTWEARNS